MRRTGRTTKLIKRAAELVMRGNDVSFVCPTESIAAHAATVAFNTIAKTSDARGNWAVDGKNLRFSSPKSFGTNDHCLRFTTLGGADSLMGRRGRIIFDHTVHEYAYNDPELTETVRRLVYADRFVESHTRSLLFSDFKHRCERVLVRLAMANRIETWKWVESYDSYTIGLSAQTHDGIQVGVSVSALVLEAEWDRDIIVRDTIMRLLVGDAREALNLAART